MLEAILRFSVERRGVVLIAAIFAALCGGYSLSILPIDVVPDITSRQVKINALASSLSPDEIEKQVAFPLETALQGIPGLEQTRSLSRTGYAQITAIFRDEIDIYFARQQVAESLTGIARALPDDVAVSLGPISTGLSEIYMWTVRYERPSGDEATARDGEAGWQSDGSYLTPEGESLRTEVELTGYLRTLQDWVIRPQIATVTGIAGVDAVGGYVKQYVIEPNPYTLTALDLTLSDLVTALERSNQATGAGFVERNGESFVVRANGRLQHPEEFSRVVVAERYGMPVLLEDVASVAIGGELRRGSASGNGEELVLGTALMRIGENSRTVASAVGRKLQEIRRGLPPGVIVETVLDRSDLVAATIQTVRNNLLEGALPVGAGNSPR